MHKTARPAALRYRILGPVLVTAIAASIAIGGTAQAAAPDSAASVAAPATTTVSPTAATAGVVASYADRRHVPRVVSAWASAWNDASPERMAALFTADGTYQDFAFGASFQGRAEVASWVSTTTATIKDVHVEVTDAFRAGDRVSVRYTFSGQVNGAPTPFSVSASTVMELQGGKITYNGDYYNLADVLRQSGLPAAG